MTSTGRWLPLPPPLRASTQESHPTDLTLTFTLFTTSPQAQPRRPPRQRREGSPPARPDPLFTRCGPQTAGSPTAARPVRYQGPQPAALSRHPAGRPTGGCHPGNCRLVAEDAARRSGFPGCRCQRQRGRQAGDAQAHCRNSATRCQFQLPGAASTQHEAPLPSTGQLHPGGHHLALTRLPSTFAPSSHPHPGSDSSSTAQPAHQTTTSHGSLARQR